MKNDSVIPIPTDFKVNINYEHPQSIISEANKIRIEEIWKNELIRTQGKLFNGELLSADNFDGKHLRGHFVEYKLYIAQTRDPSLMDELRITPICVCGYTTAGDFILIGKRADHVTDYQNYFELVPAGGIDPSAIVKDGIDIIKQIKIELKEEAGIEAMMVRSIIPSFLIFYPGNRTYEICAKIELDPSVRNLVLERDEEYTELMWIPKSSMNEFIRQHRQKIIPLSLQILQLFTR